MPTFHRFMKKGAKYVLLAIVLIMAVTLVISFGPGSPFGGDERLEGDAGVIFTNITVTKADFADHFRRTLAHVRYRALQELVDKYQEVKLEYKTNPGEFFERWRAGKIEWPQQLMSLLFQDRPEAALEQIRRLVREYRFGTDEGRNKSTWDDIILLQDAQEKGIVVSDEEARRAKTAFFGYLPGGSKNPRAAAAAQEFLALPSARSLDVFFREAVAIRRLLDLVAQAEFVSYRRVYDELLGKTSEGRVLVAELDPKRFVRRDQAIHSNRITSFYEKNKDLYRIPTKIQAYYLMAPFEGYKGAAENPTDTQVEEYWKAHQDEFVKTPARGNRPAQIKKLTEVRGEIVDKLKLQKARTLAYDAMSAVRKRLDARLETGAAEGLVAEVLFADLRAILPSPTETQLKDYFERNRKLYDDFEKERREITAKWWEDRVAEFRRSTTSKENKAAWEETRKRLDAGAKNETAWKSVRADGKSLKRLTPPLFRKDDAKGLAKEIGRPLGRTLRDWGFVEGRKVGDISPLVETAFGSARFLVRRKTLPATALDDLLRGAPKGRLETDITTFFPENEIAEVEKQIGKTPARSDYSSRLTLKHWGFDQKPEPEIGEMSRTFETDKGYAIFRLQRREKEHTSPLNAGVRSRIVKRLREDQRREYVNRIAHDMAQEIGRHGLAAVRKKRDLEFRRSRFFRLDGRDSALKDDYTLGRAISGAVVSAKMKLGDTHVLEGVKAGEAKKNSSFLIYLEDQIERVVDRKSEVSDFRSIRGRMEREARGKVRRTYLDIVANRARLDDKMKRSKGGS